VRYQHPAGPTQPAVTLTWYHGGRQPAPEILAPELASQWKSGVLFIGDKGMLLSDYGRHLLLPEQRFAGAPAPAPFIPDSIGHHAEWIQACKTGSPTTCSFDYSGALTEAVLVGNLAYRAGTKIEWDSRHLQAKGCREAEPFIQHEYRRGWKL
jgi:hypothetical protein